MPDRFRLVLHASSRAFNFAATESGFACASRQKLNELHALEAQQYVDPVTFADIHASLGESEEALRWYELAD